MQHRAQSPTLPSHRVRIGVGAVIVLVLLAFGIAVFVAGARGAGGSVSVPTQRPHAQTPQPTAASGSATVAAHELVIHVIGAVNKPGLVSLPKGARVVDALTGSGGFTDDADQAALNLAREVVDGEQIYVPRQGEAPPASTINGNRLTEAGSSAGGLLNVNRATATELETLPRIGPALAARIVEWRETNGPFGSVDDLLNVSGIGPKVLEGFAGKVTV